MTRKAPRRAAPALPQAPDADHVPAPVDLACESVAGEEDPGASGDTPPPERDPPRGKPPPDDGAAR